MEKVDLFKYLDFRQYLADLSRNLKENGSFNVRSFAQRAGLKAPGYLKMVIDGRRNLTPDTVQRFCHALEIAGREKLYFEKLVLYNQTGDPDLKKEYFDDLMSLRPRASEYLEGIRLSRYLSRPYYVTIREMVTLKDFREEPKWIARRCFPPVSPSQVREAIETLLELGLLKRNGDGRLVQTEEFVKTEDRNTQAATTYHYHEAVLDKTRRALGHLKQEERHFDALTFPLPKEMFGEIVAEFYQFRDRILEKIRQGQRENDEVFQINFQIYPTTRGVQRK